MPMLLPSPRRALRAVLAACLLSAPVPAGASDGPRAVMELFTSQGCSSCPPADRLVTEISRRSDLVVLSYPVDYWDYLGWQDTLASPANSARQRDYAAARGDRDVYTPQIVVNGQDHMVGSDRRALDVALESAAPLPVDVEILPRKDVLTIRVDGRMPVAGGMATVMLALVAAPVSVDIGRGENRGREVVYTNVVRSLRAVGMWDGGRVEFRLPMSDLKKMKAQRCAVIVQMEDGGRPGRILGAAIR
ncbi:DUF1223 domain-containing protein [Stappia stellulata]|uniref:DUF1223 domain-containing protein n=1 Tax=Stappia stellulata TaxID=71235 RepID=UPI00040B091D|nr:DUF1223 domain-containing protein [Stappia stellulata]